LGRLETGNLPAKAKSFTDDITGTGKEPRAFELVMGGGMNTFFAS
tara:strand:- start:332 stop:466 length:135 start_codon:yes stop_codon:yes gene_type:complete